MYNINSYSSNIRSTKKTGAVTQQTETDGTTNKTKEDIIQNDGEQQNKEAQPKDKSNRAEAVSNEVHSFPLYFTSVFFMLLVTDPCYLI
jgi:hypothetical protein